MEATVRTGVEWSVCWGGEREGVEWLVVGGEGKMPQGNNDHS